MLDTSSIKNHAAKVFISQFLTNRTINLEFYNRVPNDKFDYRIVDRPEKKSDSVRESLAHQGGVEKDYIQALITGKLEFTQGNDIPLKSSEKEEKLKELEELDKKLIDLLSKEEFANKLIQVPWNAKAISSITMLYGLNEHEILHTGWNLAVMDLLGIERFPALKEMWG